MRVTPWLYVVGSRQFGLSSRYDCHVYALRSSAGVLLIDAGSGFGHEQIVANLRAEFGPGPLAGTILLTHRHPDHICGAARLSAELGWPIAAPAQTAAVLEAGDEAGAGLTQAQAQGGYPAELRLAPAKVARIVEHAVPLNLEGFEIEPVHVPSHSADSFAYLFTHDGLRCCVTGDIVFYGGVVGLINTPDSSLTAYRDNLPRLANRAIDALLPGHGLFTLEGGQRHIDVALRELNQGFVPRCIGQGDHIF